MMFTPKAKEILKRLEGCKLVAYKDAAGYWTVGYGHRGDDVTPASVWSQEKAELALDRDIARFTAGVKSVLGEAVDLTDSQFSAIVILSFNIGLHALAESTLLRVLQAGHLEAVPAQIARWNKVHLPSGAFAVSPILVKRREVEIKLWLEGAPVA